MFTATILRNVEDVAISWSVGGGGEDGGWKVRVIPWLMMTGGVRVRRMFLTRVDGERENTFDEDVSYLGWW